MPIYTGVRVQLPFRTQLEEALESKGFFVFQGHVSSHRPRPSARCGCARCDVGPNLGPGVAHKSRSAQAATSIPSGPQERVAMQFIPIDSIHDERVDAYVNLTELQLRNRLEPERGLFIAESPKVITRALAAHREPISLLVERSWIDDMAEMFHDIDKRWGSDIPVYIASQEQLKQLTGYRLHRGALSAMRRWPLPRVEDICRDARRVAIMENIVDHTNVGALMRSAAALDVDAVLVTPSCGDPLYRRAARVSMGTVFQIPWTRIGSDHDHDWAKEGVARLHELGFVTAAMALDDDSISLDELVGRLHAPQVDARHIERLALIFGTEGDGLSKRTIAHADLTVKIPMGHDVDSLNVAASSAVAFYATRP